MFFSLKLNVFCVKRPIIKQRGQAPNGAGSQGPRKTEVAANVRSDIHCGNLAEDRFEKTAGER